MVTLETDGSSGSLDDETLFAKELVTLFDLWKRKHKSYGSSNLDKFGIRGILIRVSDKVERLINLIWKDVKNPLTDESSTDTWADIAVYCIIAGLMSKGKWHNEKS